MTTTLSSRHLERLAVVAGLERAVYEAALKWAPNGAKATEARAKLAGAEARAAAAKVEFDKALSDVTQRDRALGIDLQRLHAAGRLSRESIGGAGVPLIDAVLAAEAALGKANTEAQSARAASSDAQGASASKWRDVLLAADRLRDAADTEVSRGVARVICGGDTFTTGAPTNADAVADVCRTRLKALGVKA